MQLVENLRGNYRFLTGIAPYSSGVAADDGYEIIHATLAEPVPYRKGFNVIDDHLKVIHDEQVRPLVEQLSHGSALLFQRLLGDARILECLGNSIE